MQKVFDTFAIIRSVDIVRYFSVLSIACLGYAFGRTLMTPAAELAGSHLIQALLVTGTCMFAQYIMFLRKSWCGVSRNPNGCVRPALKELLLCGGLNGAMIVIATASYIAKPYLF